MKRSWYINTDFEAEALRGGRGGGWYVDFHPSEVNVLAQRSSVLSLNPESTFRAG